MIDALQQPGDAIRKMMEMKGWSQTELATVLGKPIPVVNGLIHGKRTITPELAVALASAFSTDADFWLALEAQRQLSELPSVDESVQQRALCFKIAPVKDMQKRGWIKPDATADELVSELKRFYGSDDLSSVDSLPVSPRRTSNDDEAPLTPQQLAWCYRARQIAASTPVAEYSEDKLPLCVKKLRELAAFKPEIRQVSTVLADFGIRFVVVEPLPSQMMDGAAFWLEGNSPVIAMSLLRDRIDNFWFTLFHEISHVRHGDDNAVDVDLSGATTITVEKSARERRADNEAATDLIDPQTLKSFIDRVSPMYSRDRIVQFAHKIKLHPGMVVGQLQHRGEIGFHALKEFLVKIRDVVTSTAVTDGWGQSISESSLR